MNRLSRIDSLRRIHPDHPNALGCARDGDVERISIDDVDYFNEQSSGRKCWHRHNSLS